MSRILKYTLPEHLAARQAAKRREGGVQLLAMLVAAGCFVGASLFIGPVNRIRQERQLAINPESVKDLPPEIALLGKLGTFRALAIDWAAIRAERLKGEGKTYEALQLYETVCALAPRFPTVWANAAWNMAYNISVLKYTPEARWQWVRNGIQLLRDKGIEYNPRAVILYKELAWIYWHKIGDFMDDHHMSYKRALAVEMERVLGAPPVVLTEEEYLDWFRRIVEAPRDLGDFIRRDEEVAELVVRLRGADLGPDETLLEFVARHVRPELLVSDLVADRSDGDPRYTGRMELLTDAAHRGALERLLAAVRSRVLQERYRLDPDLMLELMEEWGPLDWRNTFTHGLYWASLGDRVSEGHRNLKQRDQINNARHILNAVNSLITKGRITLWPDFDDPFSSYLELTPDTRFIPSLYDKYLEVGKKYFGTDPRFREGTPGPTLHTGFVTAMHNWIELLYLEGGERNLETAENFFVWLRENNPHPNGSPQERYLRTLDQFVMGDVLAQLETYRAAGAFIRSFIQRGLKQFALGLTQAGVMSLRRARQAYDFWMADTDVDINDRRKMQPFAVILRDAIEAYLKYPRIAALYKARLWRHLPLRLRQGVYGRMTVYFDRLCKEQELPWDVAVAFPEPPGMEEFRREDIEYRSAPRREGIEEGTRYKG